VFFETPGVSTNFFNKTEGFSRSFPSPPLFLHDSPKEGGRVERRGVGVRVAVRRATVLVTDEFLKVLPCLESARHRDIHDARLSVRRISFARSIRERRTNWCGVSPVDWGNITAKCAVLNPTDCEIDERQVAFNPAWTRRMRPREPDVIEWLRPPPACPP
jgi:hypothetical protein